MSTQVKQVVFVGLAGVLILFMVWMLRPQGNPAAAPSSVGGPPAGAGSAAAPAIGSGQQQEVDPAIEKRLAELQAAVQQDPKDVKSLTELGDILFELQQFPRAADNYASLLEIEPKNGDVRTKLGNAYFFQGMAKSAIREYKSVVETDPSKVEAHFYLALALSHSSPPDIDAAMKSWEEVVKLAPDSDLGKKSMQFIDAYQKQQK